MPLQPPPHALACPAPPRSDEGLACQLFDAVRPSVVHVSPLRSTQTFSSLDPARLGPGHGCGFLFDAYGHVITAYSTVRGAGEVKVGGRECLPCGGLQQGTLLPPPRPTPARPTAEPEGSAAAAALQVTLYDQSTATARVVGWDPAKELAGAWHAPD